MSVGRLSILWLSLCLTLTSGGSALAAEEILNWHSDITVHEDASMSVTETIKVRAEGNRIKRGIYRDFPTKYKDRAGNRVTVDSNLLGVKKNGAPEPYHTEKRSNGIRIYAGKSNVFLRPGVYTYEISYDTDRQLGFFRDHDELYWNVTGNGWEMPILRATATVGLPPLILAGDLQMAGYVGPQGSRDRNVDWSLGPDGRVTFTSGRILDSGEGLTLVLGWPKGYIAEPGRVQKSVRFIYDNRSLAAALAGLLVLFIYYMWAWQKAGKDPLKGTVIPLFEPPDNLSPASMRYIMEMGFDNQAFAAAVINLAVKGSLTIADENRAFGFAREYTLHRIHGEPKTALSKGEQKILNRLFPGGSNTLKLESKNHSRVSSAISALKDLLAAEYQKTTFINNRGYFTAGLLISVVMLFLVGVSGGISTGSPLLFIVLWFVPWTAATLFLWASRKFFMAAAFTLFLLGAGTAFTRATSITFILAIALVVVVNMIFYVLLKSPTNLGRRLMDRIDGFRMYLATAEEHRLEKLHPPEKTPELFEKYLPYALALEVDQAWSEKFAEVLARAAESGEYRPQWYHGSHWDRGRSGSFASTLGSSLSSAVSSASTAPGSSSGFGGGGSSGGGGGGGGGGGW
jgi:uncharacterized membrane protein YgcG